MHSIVASYALTDKLTYVGQNDVLTAEDSCRGDDSRN